MGLFAARTRYPTEMISDANKNFLGVVNIVLSFLLDLFS